MNLMLHIVAKDFRRLRDRLAWWFAVMVLKTGVALWLLWGPGVDDATYDHVGKALIVLVSTEVALTFLLAAMIVQDDPLAGEQPFWRTRPISGRRLLGAKVIGLFVLLGLPVVLTALPWWMACGGGPAEIGWAAGQLLIVQFIIIAPAVLMASLTESLGRFLVWSLVLLLAHSVVPMTLPMLLSKSSHVPAAAMFTRLIAYFALAVLVGNAVVVAQYLGVRRRHSIVGLVAGGIVALAVAVYWPRDWRVESLGLIPGDRTETAAVGLEVANVKVFQRTPRSAYENLNARVRVTGLPAGTYLGGAKSEHLWQWSDGTEYRVRGWGISSHQGMLDAARLALKVPASPAEAEERVRDENWSPIVGATVRDPFVARIRSEPPKYSLSAELAVYRPEPLIEAPVRDGAWRAQAGHGLRVLRVGPPGANHEVNVVLLTTVFTSSSGGIWSFVLFGRRPDVGLVPFLLVDREEGRVKPLGESIVGKLIIAGIEVGVPIVKLAESDVLDAQARGLEVAWMGWQRSATFNRTAVVERLEVR